MNATTDFQPLNSAEEVQRAKVLAKYVPVPESGCWLWLGYCVTKGYGRVRGAHGAKDQPAHRFFYEHHVGPIPTGMLVCHKCDTPMCVNPDHLFLGTNADNMTDKVQKGRSLAGGRNPNSRLTEDEVREIFLSAEGKGVLAARFGVHPYTIRNIRRRRYWQNVTADLTREPK